MKQTSTSTFAAACTRRICLAFATAVFSVFLLPCMLCPAAAHAASGVASSAASSAGSSSSSSLLSALSAFSGDDATVLSGSSQPAVLVELPRTSMVFKISGDSPFEFPDFVFWLKPTKVGYPMPADAAAAGKSCTLQGAGNVDFGSISFEKPGVYTYEISQEAGADAAWSYDTSVYELKVVVVQKDEGLSATKTLAKDDQQQDQAVFTNSYRLPANGAAQSAGSSQGSGAADESSAQERSVEVGPLTLEEQEAAEAEAQNAGTGRSAQSTQDDSSASTSADTTASPQMRPQPAADGLATGEKASARGSVQTVAPDADPTLVAAVVTGAVAAISIAGVALATLLRTRRKEQV